MLTEHRLTGRLLACALALSLGLSGAASAQCRLALALGLDVSASVDANEYELQRLGLAAALGAPDVRHAILSGAPGDVALAVYEWSGFFQQTLHLDWTWLRSEADIDRARGALANMRRGHDDFPTAVGQALGYGGALLARSPDCARRVLDLSGDGVHNHGYGPDAAYRNFPLRDVTVNGLVIGQDPEIAEFYRNKVLFGPAAFMIRTEDFAGFEAAMTRKLYREINDIMLGDLAPAPPRPAPPVQSPAQSLARPLARRVALARIGPHPQ
ncbi:DUF1194 domain-containing protein [Roseovarius sp. C7]|uniref:DUF1194 domain-containing protein n=1 Tax=Roseovarius sp. C7 TaxID=3398643 RepID=UPI0039F70B8D